MAKSVSKVSSDCPFKNNPLITVKIDFDDCEDYLRLLIDLKGKFDFDVKFRNKTKSFIVFKYRAESNKRFFNHDVAQIIATCCNDNMKDIYSRVDELVSVAKQK